MRAALKLNGVKNSVARFQEKEKEIDGKKSENLRGKSTKNWFAQGYGKRAKESSCYRVPRWSFAIYFLDSRIRRTYVFSRPRVPPPSPLSRARHTLAFTRWHTHLPLLKLFLPSRTRIPLFQSALLQMRLKTDRFHFKIESLEISSILLISNWNLFARRVISSFQNNHSNLLSHQNIFIISIIVTIQIIFISQYIYLF